MHGAGPVDLRRVFHVALGLTLALRLALAAAVPYTGDEAYFTTWGGAPAPGFYDHPPMVGWLLAGLLRVSHAAWVLRLPSVLLPAVIAVGIARLLQPHGERTAHATALAYLLSVAAVLNIAITTDTPLVLFCFLSLASFAVAVRRDSLPFYVLAGVCLGLACLSKFFAAFLGLGFFVFALASPGRERRWRGTIVAFACAAPFIAFLVWWNYENCWANFMFNLYNRHGDAGWSWRKPIVYALLVVYLSSPLLLIDIGRARRSIRARLADAEFRLYAACAAAPLALFAVLSLVKDVGLHWLFAFIPAVFLAAGRLLDARQLLRSARFLAWFSAAHVVAVAVILALPIETWHKTRWYDGLVLAFHPGEVRAVLEPYEREFVLASDGYTTAATMGYEDRRYWPVFGEGSRYARHDDILTDFRALAGRNILVLTKSAPDMARYQPYFREVEVRSAVVRGATYHLVLGRGFRYEPYRDEVLTAVRDRFYRIPAYLPQGRCYFCERYFGARTCPAR